nr:MAG TPA: hypothetical protein [Caudoviricetes sp.]
MNIAHHQRQKCYSRNELQGIQILRTKVTESVRKEKNELRQKQHPSHENGRHKKDAQKNVQSPPGQKD